MIRYVTLSVQCESALMLVIDKVQKSLDRRKATSANAFCYMLVVKKGVGTTVLV